MIPIIPLHLEPMSGTLAVRKSKYMMHHFFITPRALFVLIADDRKQNTEFDYWFRIINLLGRESIDEKIRVLVVLNEVNHDSITSFDLDTYTENYPNLKMEKRDVDFSKNDLRFADLEKTIQQKLCDLPHVGDPLPRLWKPIRQDLQEKRKESPHITFDEYSRICNKLRNGKQLTRKEDQLFLSRYLHRLGVILHYEQDDSLFNFVILNPQWAVDAVYSVLKDKRVVNNNGRFTARDLRDFWEKYSADERNRLLNLMLKDKFEISYRSLKQGEYIAPQLLPSNRPPYTWNSRNTMKFRYQYAFMPKGLISRLIVRLSDDIAGEKRELVWKEGVRIKGQGCQAQIIREKTVKEGLEVLDIEVDGPERERKFLLRKIMEAVELIHERSFPHIIFERMIPCNCEYCSASENPIYFEYSELLQYEQENWEEIDCRMGKLKKVSVRGLLEGVFERGRLIIVESKHGNRIYRRRDEEKIGVVNIYQGHVTRIEGGDVKKISQTTHNRAKPPLKSTPEKWYEKWLFISISVGVIIFLLTWWISDSLKMGAVAGVIAAVFMIFRNPDYWLRRLARASFSAFIGTLYLNISIAYKQKTEEGSFSFELFDPPVILSLGLLIFALGCIFAQVWQEKKG